MIKVCHITSVHPPFDIRIFYKECVSLANAGYDVTLLAPIKDATVKEGVTILPLKLPKSRIARMLMVPFKVTKVALKTKATVFHLHDPELLPSAILIRLGGKKVVFDVHENVRISLISKHWLPKWLAFVLSWVYYAFERFATLFVNKLVLAEVSYLKYYPNKKSTVVLNYPLVAQPNAIDIPVYEPIKFIYSGVVHPLRGIWEMLGIIKYLKEEGYNITFDLVGELRPAGLHNQVLEYLAHHQMSNIVLIHGKVDFKDVSGLLKGCHVGLSILKPIPNYYESLPTKIFEYMQHGLVVVANNFPLYKKFVETPHTGICVDIENLETMCIQVKQLIQEKENLKKMSENGMRAVQTEFNWNSEQEKLLKLYSELMS